MLLRPKYRILAVSLIISLYIAFKMFMPAALPEESKIVEIYKAEKSNLRITKKLLGWVEAKNFFQAHAGMQGNISYVEKAGTYLKKGDVIASMNFPETITSYKNALEASKIAQSQYLREKQLLKRGATSKNNVETAYKELARVNASLAAAKMLYDKVEFLAPFDGVVGSPVLHAGAYANIGDDIVAFYDNSKLIVKFDIPGDIAASAKQVTKAKINDNEYEVYVQKLLSKDTYSAPAYSDFHCDSCLIGDVVQVELYIRDSEDTLVLPTSCVFIKDAKSSVYKVIGDKAILSEVKVGARQENQIEILEGVETGDLIVKDGQGRLFPDVKVEIHNSQEL